MAELLRDVLAHRTTRIVLMVLGLALAGWFLASGLRLGAAADGCATQLLEAANAKDEATVRRLVRNPSIQEKLLKGASVELTFVRPVSDEWSRVGLVVTSTVRTPIALQLDARGDDCVFLRDYE